MTKHKQYYSRKEVSEMLNMPIKQLRHLHRLGRFMARKGIFRNKYHISDIERYKMEAKPRWS